MAKKITCDRCHQDITDNMSSLLDFPFPYQEEYVPMKIGGQVADMQYAGIRKIKLEKKDICGACITELLRWWTNIISDESQTTTGNS